jgi:regulatory protein
MGNARLSFQPTLKGRALRLLSQREHSRRELERKLQPYEEEPGALALALDELQARGFISEARVVDSVLNRRAGRLGAARIRQELQDKGLEGELIERALSGLKDSEFARARQVWQRKFDASPQTPQELARQARFLLARGFAGEVVRRVLGGDAADEEA